MHTYLISIILFNTSQFVENLVRAWRDDNLDLETFGINGNLIAEAKNDGGDILDNFIAGEPASFQKELLQGIGFLQERIQRSESDPDAITVVSRFNCNGSLISCSLNSFEPYMNFLKMSFSILDCQPNLGYCNRSFNYHYQIFQLIKNQKLKQYRQIEE